MKVSVIGLGHIGLPMAVLYASRGFDVIGIDLNKEVVKAVNDKRVINYEPDLEHLLKFVTLKATTDVNEVSKTDVTFIMLSSPSGKDDYFKSDNVEACVKQIAPIINKKESHLVVVVTTLMPNTMDSVISPYFKKHINLCYNPTFIAFGNILKNLSEPDALLIGQRDEQSGEMLQEFYSKICLNTPTVKRMSFVNAELSKLLLNCFVTTKISVANTCAEICESYKGGDTDAVMGFLGLDSRIGKKCLKGGTGFGGDCFPRDSRALVALTKRQGINGAIQMSTGFFNDCHDINIGSKISYILGKEYDATIAILGVTYKPDTDSVVESSVIKIIKGLLKDGRKIRIYDPEGLENTRKELGDVVYYAKSTVDCLKGTSLAVIAVDWAEFKNLSVDVFLDNMKTPRVFDIWRIHREFSLDLEYHAIGVGS